MPLGIKVARNCVPQIERSSDPHRQLAAAACSPRKQKIRNVGTGNQKNKTNSSHEHQDGRTYIPGQFLSQRNGERANFRIGIRMLFLQLLRDDGKIGVG